MGSLTRVPLSEASRTMMLTNGIKRYFLRIYAAETAPSASQARAGRP